MLTCGYLGPNEPIEMRYEIISEATACILERYKIVSGFFIKQIQIRSLQFFDIITTVIRADYNAMFSPWPPGVPLVYGNRMDEKQCDISKETTF